MFVLFIMSQHYSFRNKYCSFIFFFFSSRRRHTRCGRDWSSDVCSSDLLFFTAILPQFIDTNYSIAAQIVILGLSSIVVEFFILFGYGQLAGRTLSAVKNPRFEKISNRFAGSLLIGADLRLARLRWTHTSRR